MGITRTLTALALLMAVLTGHAVAAQDDAVKPHAQQKPKGGLDLERYMPLSEIRPGMIGTVRTVFSGRKIEEFQVEVLGVLGSAGPAQSAIIVRCLGERMARTGVAAGMSGSPMYIDGRMVGALAFTWLFAREPIAGIRPIEDMLMVDERPTADTRRIIEARHHEIKIQQHNFSSVATSGGEASIIPGTLIMTPIATPLMVSGASPMALEALQEFARKRNMVLVQSTPVGRSTDVPGHQNEPRPAADALPAADIAKTPFAPGDAIGILLMDGDLTLGATGTVTDVNGDQVWAFGHGFNEGGNLFLPITTADVITIISRINNSFKLSNLGPIVGTMRRDEAAAIYGRTGLMPENLADIVMEVYDPGATSPRRYNYRAADHYSVIHELGAVSALSSLVANNDLPRTHTVRYRFDITSRNHPQTLTVAGAAGGSVTHILMAMDLRNALAPLVQNDYLDLQVAAIKGRIDVDEDDRRVSIAAARTIGNDVRPGQLVPISLTLIGTDKTPMQREIQYTVPDDLPDGTYRLEISDNATHIKSTLTEQPHFNRIRGIDDLMRLAQLRAAPNAYYLRLHTDVQGLAVEGQTLPDLPPSMKSVITSSSGPTDVYAHQPARVTVLECELLPSGRQNINLTVSRSARPQVRAAASAN